MPKSKKPKPKAASAPKAPPAPKAASAPTLVPITPDEMKAKYGDMVIAPYSGKASTYPGSGGEHVRPITCGQIQHASEQQL